MKILKLRFKNLNSLQGEWSIDFTAPEYITDGIFAITGPTGAGKTTVLDAICLALYGTTPRLGKITKSSNEIMSRHANDCFAEVTFETQSDKYVCFWSQRKTTRKNTDNLAESKHEISDAVSGHILESKKRNVAEVIEEKTGMNFERFTRSILLAQGEFAGFLRCPPNERTPILEQITGTEIYSQISKTVHERQRSEQETLNVLTAEISGISLLNEEQESDIKKELSGNIKKETLTRTKFEQASQSIEWLAGINNLKIEINRLNQALEQKSTELKEANADRQKLIRAQKAAELDGSYAVLLSTRQQQITDKETLKLAEEQFLSSQTKLEKKEFDLKKSGENVRKLTRDFEKEQPLIQEVNKLDDRIAEKQKLILAAETEYQKKIQTLEEQQAKHRQVIAGLEEVKNSEVPLQNYISEHKQDETLITQMTGIEGNLIQFETARAEAIRKKKHLTEEEETLSQFKSKLTKLELSRTNLNRKIENLNHLIIQKNNGLQAQLNGRLLREYRIEKDTLQREYVYMQKISDLEQERKKLEDGKACPLCGALHHPYAEGNLPIDTEIQDKITRLTKFIHHIEELEQQIAELQKQEKEGEASIKLTNLNLEITRITAGIENSETLIEKYNQELISAEEHLNRLKSTVFSCLQEYGIETFPEDSASVINVLKKRQKKWLNNQAALLKIENQRNELNNEILRLEAIIATTTEALKDKERSLNDTKLEGENYRKKRRELYGEKNPGEEQTRYTTEIQQAQNIETKLRNEFIEMGQHAKALTERCDNLKERIAYREKDLQDKESDFIESLKSAGFENEAEFEASRLTPEYRKHLEMRLKNLVEKHAELQSLVKNGEKRLREETEKNITEKTLEILADEQTELEQTINSFVEKSGALKQQLAENVLAKDKIQKKQNLIDRQTDVCRKWNKLHHLIGSADGKKFRNFAQEITFEIVVAQANRQLHAMSDRYSLICDPQNPLELNVIDNYQAGEIRSAKNLSGGESFIVSLSLALGLSRIAGKNIRVDSLFLDEGFGTLDEDALETALETLAELKNDGKLIGIISHVPLIKDRIPTQISVMPIANGKSKLTGPGCKEKTATEMLLV